MMMRKIIIILLSVISVAYAQDSTRSIYPADRGGVGYKINNAELKGRAIDSTRIFKMGSDTVLRVTDKWYARFAGIYGNGSDMTAKINLFNSRSYVGKMTFEYDTITNVTVNGTVNFVKPVEIGRNASFTGTGTINFNGNILDADPDKVIFGPNITVTGLRTRNGLIPARWFGAVADGATDNYSFFTKAQSAASSGMTVQIARGDHRINSTFTQTVNFLGDPGSTVKYNTASVATGLYMWTLSAPGISLKNLTLDGSDKCMTIVRIGAFPDIHLIGDTLMEWNQVGAEASNTQAVFFGQGSDRFKVMHCTLKNGDAKNNSVVRGIRGDYAGVGPVGAEIGWNVFSGIRGTAAGLDDADDICVQSFTNDLGMKIHHNLHLDMWKRAAKLMSNGIEYYENQIWSNRYATNSTKSWSVYSVYGNHVHAHNNTLWTGIFENCVDIGPYQDGSGPIIDCRIENERFFMSTGASGTKDGIVVFGTNNNNITLKNNYIQNCRNGIASRGNARNFSIINNFVYNSTDNAYSLASTNTYPNNWFYNMNFNGNTARKCLQATIAIGRVSGGSILNNNSDSCSDDLILNYAPYVDSLLGVAASGNTVSPAGYGSGKRVNLGTYAQRLTLSNPNTLPGLRYVAIDSSNASYLYQGGVYVKIGASAGGSGISGLTALRIPYANSSTNIIDDATLTFNPTTKVVTSDSLKAKGIISTSVMQPFVVDTTSAIKKFGNIILSPDSLVFFYNGNRWVQVNAAFEKRDKIRVAAGVIRPSISGSTITWEFLSTSDHSKIYFDSVHVNNSQIQIFYPHADNVISFAIIPDETLTKYGVVCGGSVGTDSASVTVYRQSTPGGYWRGNGSTYVAYGLTGWDISYTSGVMQFNPYLYGGTTLNPDYANSPMIYVGKNGYHIERKMSGLSKSIGFTVTDQYGNTVTDAPTTDDVIQIGVGTISNIQLNPGAVSGTNLEATIFGSLSNFWVIGIFEKD